uniref:GB1/RHD3-type G domain-containing protein n=1 Tax=Gopherus evgoodei TaxID=1825980 RepID=A0A8C4WJQ2_9SAUR
HTQPSQPVCLVANPADGELEVMEEALEALRGVDQPVVVVAVAGLYRTGKSYLLNQLGSRWAPRCSRTPRASGCGACPTRAGPATPCNVGSPGHLGQTGLGVSQAPQGVRSRGPGEG